MSGADRLRPWPGEPGRCTCTSKTAAGITGTLDCPLPWRPLPGTGWIHAAGWIHPAVRRPR